MAVFTELDHAKMRDWLSRNYAIELAAKAEPIAAGIENSNYKIRAADDRSYIVTIIEKWSFATARYCIDLAHHFNRAGLPVPAVIANLAKARCTELMAKPAVVIEFVAGSENMRPDASACETLGATVARLHAAATGFEGRMDNPRNHAWRASAAARMRAHMDANDQRLLAEAMAIDAKLAAAGLATIACHCDLFRNNVLWHRGELAGIIDFFFAGDDLAGFDLGVAAVDWSQDDAGRIDIELLAALARGYLGVAGSLPATPSQLADLMVSGALRFWLSRLVDVHEPRTAVMLTPHDPQVFRDRLGSCLAGRDQLRACLAAPA